MKIKFDEELNINGVDFWIVSEVHIPEYDSSENGSYWGGSFVQETIELGEPELLDLTVIAWSEEDQGYENEISDKNIIKQAKEWVELESLRRVE